MKLRYTVLMVRTDNQINRVIATFDEPFPAVEYAEKRHKRNSTQEIPWNIYVFDEETNHVIFTFYFGE